MMQRMRTRTIARGISKNALPVKERARYQKIIRTIGGTIVNIIFFGFIEQHTKGSHRPTYRRCICGFGHYIRLVHGRMHPPTWGRKELKCNEIKLIVWTNNHRGSIPRFPTKPPVKVVHRIVLIGSDICWIAMKEQSSLGATSPDRLTVRPHQVCGRERG